MGGWNGQEEAQGGPQCSPKLPDRRGRERTEEMGWNCTRGDCSGWRWGKENSLHWNELRAQGCGMSPEEPPEPPWSLLRAGHCQGRSCAPCAGELLGINPCPSLWSHSLAPLRTARGILWTPSARDQSFLTAFKRNRVNHFPL